MGKTHAAKLISLATSLRRATGHESGATKDHGNNLVVVSCSALKHRAVEFIQSHVIALVTTHLAKFPHGIVLIDDAQDLPPEAFAALAPLLGSATTFPEAPHINLHYATVIMTSDFGREGRTRGLSSEELKQLIDDEMRASYKYANVKQVTTVPFLPFSTEMAAQMLLHSVEKTTCRMAVVESATVSPEASRTILRRLTENLSIHMGNGRSIAQEISSLIDTKVSEYSLANGMDVKVTVLLTIGPAGEIVRQITPLDNASATEEF